MPDYSSPLYWQERYAHDPSASFDWYLTYDELKPHLVSLLARGKTSDYEIFIPGCGNSPLGARLHSDGFVNISNVDISSVAISQVRDRYSDLTEMDFSVLDCADMKEELPEPCFDLVRGRLLQTALSIRRHRLMRGSLRSASHHQTEEHVRLQPYLLLNTRAPPS